MLTGAYTERTRKEELSKEVTNLGYLYMWNEGYL